MRIRGQHYRTGDLIDLELLQQQVTAVSAAQYDIDVDHHHDWLMPGMFDPQINGAVGISFNSPELSEAGIMKVVGHCRRHGITQFFATLVTCAHEVMVRNLQLIAAIRADIPAVQQVIAGVHLEGPWLSPVDGPRGAHPKEHIRPVNEQELRRWLEAAPGLVRLVTLAPEVAGAVEMIPTLTANNIVVAIGHTAATPAQIRSSVDAGATMSTHLGNGCSAMLPRHDNFLWEQLACDHLYGSVIADGFHLPDAVLQCMIRCKGWERLLLTCDASSLAGLPPGPYHEWGVDLEILPTGKIVLQGTPYLAGSGVFLDTCVRHLVDRLRCPLGKVLHAVTDHPRQFFGLAAEGTDNGFVHGVIGVDCDPTSQLQFDLNYLLAPT
ncbi:MAG: amidohydrolase family protein [Zavarzinella sp.]